MTRRWREATSACRRRSPTMRATRTGSKAPETEAPAQEDRATRPSSPRPRSPLWRCRRARPPRRAAGRPRSAAASAPRGRRRPNERGMSGERSPGMPPSSTRCGSGRSWERRRPRPPGWPRPAPGSWGRQRGGASKSPCPLTDVCGSRSLSRAPEAVPVGGLVCARASRAAAARAASAFPIASSEGTM